uniref:Uncharacterized protein n=1 Tax=Candidatus Kentrum sp. LFY TaxID=2126342 RepID=A0A450UFL4_9GAMM|nr:MAG: hypothetical protein BECKLFY1418A_GA0070994_101526 [Candidatus Kentron sp. LFY]
MKRYHLAIYLLLVFAPFAMVNSDGNINSEEKGIKAITKSITDICDKPDNAGNYWEAKVKGDVTGVKLLKLVDVGFEGEVDFSKGEWNGIQRTIEDTNDYRACARELAPLFIEKFKPIMEQQKQQKPPDRILGGIKYQRFGMGIDMTVEFCEKNWIRLPVILLPGRGILTFVNLQ